MTALEFINQNIGARVRISGAGDLAMNGELKPLILGKAEVTLVRLTKKGMAMVVDSQGKSFMVPPRNLELCQNPET